jgi:PIN domain nuclease of toxin-antitoxin system
MSNKIVFDSSVLIMLFAKEPGYEKIRGYMRYAIISSINIAEVYKYCLEVQNLTEDDCRNLIKLTGIKIIDFCEEQALITAKIIKQTKQYGLSLGDRACIALAMLKDYQILTCDKIWQKVDLDVEFIMAR